MMTMHQTRQRAVQNGKKVQRLAVLAFFLCASLSTHAQSNIVDGTAYGTNDISTATTISSMADGDGYLAIGFQGTTSITLSNKIDGTITIDSAFSNLSITATGSTLSNWQDSVLSVTGGTNLTITGGNFTALQGTNVFELPPIPGQETQYGYATNAAIAGSISGVETATITDSRFQGATYAPYANLVQGTDALVVDNSANLIVTGVDSEFIGGDGGDIYSSSTNAYTFGGNGLVLSGSTATISNGTFQGGSTGDAVAEEGSYSLSFGGDGIHATNSVLNIHGGAFIGGNAGNATTNLGGSGVFAVDSDITIEGGTFSGGTVGTNTYFGLYSRATTGGTNNIVLNGGTFSLLGFDSEGTQYLTAGTNGLAVAEGVFQRGGTLIVTNLTDAPFQTNTVGKGTMRFVNDFDLENNGIFHLVSHESDIDFIDSDLNVSSGATIWFTATTNGTGLITADNVYFETNSTLAIANNIIGLPAGSAITNSVINASSGIYVESIPATSSNFTDSVNIVGLAETRTGFTDILLDGSTNLSLRFTTKTLREYWEAEGQFALLADELDALTNQNSALLAKIDEIADPSVSGPAAEQTYLTIRNTFQTVLNGMQAAVGQSASRGAEFREQLKLEPSGARGPQRKNDLRGWVKYYGQRLNHDADGLNPEYETELDGGVIGIDKSLGGLLVGISGGYGRYLTTSGIDGKENITAYHGSLYGTLGIGTAYIDAGVAYGFNEVETRTSSPFILNGEFDAQMISTYLGGGIDFVDSKEGMVFTPEASIQYSMYEQNAYSETGDIPRNIDALDADSLRGSIGLNISVQETMRFDTFSLKYDVRGHWIREFNPEPGNMDFSLAGGTESYELAVPMLNEDLYRVGIGCSFFNTKRSQPKNVLFRIDFDELFGDGFNSHNLSAKVICAF